jgi:Ca2+-transporting ATPase
VGPSEPGVRRPGEASRSVLDLRGVRGLTEAEAASRLAREGPNELPSRGHRTLLEMAWDVAKEPMFLMLVAAGALYLVMGEPADAALLLGFVGVVMGITLFQERRTERSLEALRDLSSPRARVLRDGVQRRIAGREVVRGDLLVVAEGDRVPADGLLRRGIHVSADESLLTGESVPVRKLPSAEATALDAPGGDDLPSLFSGTLVTAGQGIVEVEATGGASRLGRIGRALEELEPEPTPLQQETGRMVRLLAATGLGACSVMVVAYALTRGGTAQAWKEGVLAGIALAMAMLPEEFPVVLTVFLALGAWRLSRSQVLTRRVPAVETLGAATVLCVDKTGTLTQNQMTLRMLQAQGHAVDVLSLGSGTLPEQVHPLLEFAILASRRDPFDPMECALVTAGDTLLRERDSEHLHPDWALAREYPLVPGLLAVSQAWHTGDGGETVVACKGAPEAVVDLCHLPTPERERLLTEAGVLAARGLRVLAVAQGVAPGTGLPPEHHDLEFSFVGLLGFEDPLRPTVPAAVAECRAAGIRVVMITGDAPATASAIARGAGLASPDHVLTGTELDALDDAALSVRVREWNVFARVVPEQKLRLVNALKANGEVVAMTGDGVNDAPALKAAHIGVAMGGRGTDVAREAASLVLLQDDFSSIVEAVRLGRRIYDNLRRSFSFILAVHVPIAGLSLVPVFFPDWPLLLLPAHVVFLELVIDPSCTLVFEAEPADADVMRHPPRGLASRVFDTSAVARAVMQGATVLGACLAVYLLGRDGRTPEAARALTFTTLVVSFLVTLLASRARGVGVWRALLTPNAAFRGVTLGAVALLCAVLGVPLLQRLFHLAPLEPRAVLLAVGAGVLCLPFFTLLDRALPENAVTEAS